MQPDAMQGVGECRTDDNGEALGEIVVQCVGTIEVRYTRENVGFKEGERSESEIFVVGSIDCYYGCECKKPRVY